MSLERTDIFFWKQGQVVENEFVSEDILAPGVETEVIACTLAHYHYRNVQDIGFYLKDGKSKDTFLYWAANYPDTGIKILLPNFTLPKIFKLGQGDKESTPIYYLDEYGEHGLLSPSESLSVSFYIQTPSLLREGGELKIDIDLTYIKA